MLFKYLIIGIYNCAKGKVIAFAFCNDPNRMMDTPDINSIHYQKEIPIVFVQMDNDIGFSVSSSIPNVIPFSEHCDLKDKFDSHYHRWQIPLRAAFATTTHKMQGSTVKGNCVTIPSLNCPWARGLDYVANSRATELNKLFLLRALKPENFTSHEEQRKLIDNEYARLARKFGC